MAPTIVQIMDAIEARLDTIPDLNVYDITPGQVTVPAAVVGLPNDIDYHAAMKRGLIDLTFSVMVFTSSAMDRAGQRQLASYLDFTGSNSVVLAIEGDKTLGGVVDNCTPGPAQVRELDEFGLAGYYGAVFPLRVLAQGN